jgi:ribonuclease HII
MKVKVAAGKAKKRQRSTSTSDRKEKEEKQDGDMATHEIKMFEDETILRICGVDEVGTGCFAGPLVVCAALLEKKAVRIPGVRDSKKLTAKRREKLYSLLLSAPGHTFSLSFKDAPEIDTLSKQRATMLAMTEAVQEFHTRPDLVLVDGPLVPHELRNKGYKVEAIVDGDAQIYCIAAASVVAKVTRDRFMKQMHIGYPHGICPLHRRSYAPIRRIIEQKEQEQEQPNT